MSNDRGEPSSDADLDRVTGLSNVPPRAESPPLLRDFYRFQASVNEFELPLARAKYEYLCNRRDSLFDKVRTGAIVLNAASLTAVIAALGNPTVAEGKFALSTTDLAFSACAFITGLISGALGFWLEANRSHEELAKQFGRTSIQMNMRGFLDSAATDETQESLGKQIKESGEIPIQDFNISTAVWIGVQKEPR